MMTVAVLAGWEFLFSKFPEAWCVTFKFEDKLSHVLEQAPLQLELMLWSLFTWHCLWHEVRHPASISKQQRKSWLRGLVRKGGLSSGALSFTTILFSSIVDWHLTHKGPTLLLFLGKSHQKRQMALGLPWQVSNHSFSCSSCTQLPIPKSSTSQALSAPPLFPAHSQPEYNPGLLGQSVPGSLFVAVLTLRPEPQPRTSPCLGRGCAPWLCISFPSWVIMVQVTYG